MASGSVLSERLRRGVRTPRSRSWLSALPEALARVKTPETTAHAKTPITLADVETPAAHLTPWSRFLAWAGVNDSWQRPLPRVGRSDVMVVVAITATAIVLAELQRSLGSLNSAPSRPVTYALLAATCIPLLWRRRYPCTAALVAYAAFMAVSMTMPVLGGQLMLLVAFFLALYSAAAWAPNRLGMLVTVGAVGGSIIFWLIWSLAVGAGAQRLRRELGAADASNSLMSPLIAYLLFNLLINGAFLVGALIFGVSSWRRARGDAEIAAQQAQLADQAVRLRDEAVLRERLRIARDLHDVVGHHVSVTGIQAAAARRVLDRDPSRAAAALASVEESTRQAVTQMRNLLGTLRAVDENEDESSHGAPTLAQLPQLIADQQGNDLRISLDLVEDHPGAADAVSPVVALSLYRAVEEALTNVRRHSTAHQAQVVVRVMSGRYAEAEILDSGLPRPDSAGTGLGLLGMRERAKNAGGTVDAGPRMIGGYRVRMRLPLQEET